MSAFATTDVVKVSGLVLMKIMKHCRDTLPDVASGTLLGLQALDTPAAKGGKAASVTELEVTNAFASPRRDDGAGFGASEPMSTEEYQVEILRMLREVNVDNNCVGWYSSDYLGTFCNPDLIELQYRYQLEIANAVLLTFDPVSTSAGELALKAWRLTPRFMSRMEKSGSADVSSASTLSELCAADVLESVRVELYNSPLLHLLVSELSEQQLGADSVDAVAKAAEEATVAGSTSVMAQGSAVEDVDLSRLTLSAEPFIEKNLRLMSGCIEDLREESFKMQRYQQDMLRIEKERQQFRLRRRDENETRAAEGLEPLPEEDPSLPLFRPLAAPSRLDNLLISSQLSQHIQQTNTLAADSLNKLYVAQALQSSGEQ